MRRFVALFTIALAALSITAAYLIYANNRNVPMPDQAEIRASFEKAIGWIQNNRKASIESANAILWWMVMRSAELSKDPRLQELFSEYKREQLDPYPTLIWQNYFDPHSDVRAHLASVSNLPDYNLMFIYGLTCDPEFAELEIVRQQLRDDFCATHHPFAPACITHQLMGARFMREHGCGNTANVNALISVLHDRICTQLTRDPRTVDVYIQRVLMLADTHARKRIKPIWLHKVIAAQLHDGGWGSFQPLIALGAGRYLGFTTYGVDIDTPESNFHSTAQGLLLMSLMLDSQAQ